jgi:hypothetical protein
MAEQRSGSRLGGFLKLAGYLWFVFFLVGNLVAVRGTMGDVLAFFAGNLIFPIVLIFAGAAINRRVRRSTLDEALDRQPASAEPSSSPMPSRRRPAPSKPNRQNERTTAAVHRREMEEQHEREMEDMHERGMEPLHERGTDGDMHTDQMMAIEELLEKEMSYRPKTSEEMIAEAHRRWSRDA